MRLNAEIAGSTHPIELRCDGERLSVQVDDRRYELILREFAGGGWLLIDGTELHYCQVSKSVDRPGQFNVNLRGSAYEVTISDPKRLGRGLGAGGHDHGEAEILATMPGKVVRVLVELGTEVESGAGIVVVEAMKMQNELKTPKSGKVTTLNAIVGETVNAGDVLAVVE